MLREVRGQVGSEVVRQVVRRVYIGGDEGEKSKKTEREGKVE